MARSVSNVKPAKRTASPKGAAEHAIARAADDYTAALRDLERAYDRLVDAVRRHPQMPRRRVGAITGLSKSRIQQILEQKAS
ncbi:MAG: hypothetical protein ACRD1S_01015 [Vicinamibacterales bacterium]